MPHHCADKQTDSFRAKLAARQAARRTLRTITFALKARACSLSAGYYRTTFYFTEDFGSLTDGREVKIQRFRQAHYNGCFSRLDIA